LRFQTRLSATDGHPLDMLNHKSHVRSTRKNRRRVNLGTKQLGKKKSFEHVQVRTTYTHTREHAQTHAYFTALNTRHSSPCDLPLTFAVHTVPHRLHISTSGHKECALISVETDSAPTRPHPSVHTLN